MANSEVHDAEAGNQGEGVNHSEPFKIVVQCALHTTHDEKQENSKHPDTADEKERGIGGLPNAENRNGKASGQ
jgi:hypothetical protein